MSTSERDLVLWHGWAMRPRVWSPVLPGLQSSYRVYNFHLPGYGDPVPGAARDLQAMNGRQLLDAWSDACLAAAPAGAMWLAWSLGALIALNAALRSPQSIAGLLLVSATPKFVSAPDWDEGIDGGVLRGFLAGIQSNDEKVLKRFVMLQVGESDDARALGRALCASVVEAGVHTGVLAAGLRVLEEVDLRPALNNVGVPVRVIHGTQDRIVPVGAGMHVAGGVPDGDLVRLDTGHAPFATRPEAFVEAVRAWM